MLIRIDRGADTPLFTQVADQVRRATFTGELSPGDRLPSARELADSLGVNLHTVLRAYQDLREEGLLDLRRGRGAVVRASTVPDLAALWEAISVLATEARRLHLSPAFVLNLVKEKL